MRKLTMIENGTSVGRDNLPWVLIAYQDWNDRLKIRIGGKDNGNFNMSTSQAIRLAKYLIEFAEQEIKIKDKEGETE